MYKKLTSVRAIAFCLMSTTFLGLPSLATLNSNKIAIPSGAKTEYKEVADIQKSLKKHRRIRYSKHKFGVHLGGGIAESKFDFEGRPRFNSLYDARTEDSLTHTDINLELGYAYHFNPRIRAEADLSYAMNPDDQNRLSDSVRINFNDQLRIASFVSFRVYRSANLKLFTGFGLGMQSYLNQEVLVNGPGILAKLEAEFKNLSVKLTPYYFRHTIQDGYEIRNFDVESGSAVNQIGANLSVGWVGAF